ncbi:glycoside hydrolase family 2 TIM barrel-domain containing protein [uncultured Draconibacterium sp.]|uniref:glycoside hydrolase family 2 TIM barrel-domain containing protein n=1 Tax=uncultured Draconibacterium sp. TaxID=1573823 RepID=UPI0025DA728C|nr:glycoside hydrolase family 2 TIM barrel-domain containing protein [uncultured Draconibacterium sp.]
MIKKSRNLILIAVLLFLCYLGVAQTPNKVFTKKIYLSGTGKDDMVEWDFYCTDGRNSGEWTKIGVPSCWELQGFGNYNYGQDLPLEDRASEQGLYKHKFVVPEEWKNKEVKIVFEGVMTDAEVKINGKPAGDVHQGAFYEFKYSISDLLAYGKENVLEVKVSKVSANESINWAERKADFWVFGGIFRPVYLQVLPKEHIARVAIDAKADGQISADIFIDAPKAETVTATLSTLDGNQQAELPLLELKKTEGKWTLRTKAENIKSWNPESPNLYELVFSLKDKKGAILHQHAQRIGFRTVEVREADGIYVNGQRIKFKGVNRHSFYPSSGRTTSKALSIEHVQMMKDMNMNAVRMSHYPPDVHFLDVCDSLGLFVIDEVCTWHSPALDTEVGRKIVKETVVRDVNHPSILLWANGNETGWNTELDDDYAIWDIQQREVIHPWNIFRKTNTLHYFNYHAFANDGPFTDKIFFPTEFLHGLYDGGHGAGLDDYWQQMWNMPTNAGGFLWDFADEAVLRTDKDGVLDTDGNHAADGIVGPYGEKEASYFTIKEVWSPIYIENRFIRNDFNGIFRIENRYHFTNLSACKMIARWVKFKGPESNGQPEIIAESHIELPDLEPETKGKFKVGLPENWKSADVLYLTGINPQGNEVFTWSYPVQTPKAVNSKLIHLAGNNEIKTLESGDNLVITANGFEYTFSKKTNILQQVKKDGRVVPLANGPMILNHKDKIDTLYVNELKDRTEVVLVYKEADKSPAWASHKELSADVIKWTVYPNGTLNLYVEIKGKRIVDGYKGITFTYPEEEVAGKKWLGDGPYRVWRNRMKGTKFRVWENDYNNTVTGESGFVYPEFKGFFSRLYWAKIKGKNNNGFTVYCNSSNVFLRMLTPQAWTDPKRATPVMDFPEGNISFVFNIPGIGTKFQTAETSGPQGHAENYFGNYDDPLVIDLTFEF